MKLNECRVVSTPKGSRTIISERDIYDILEENDLSEVSNLIHDNVEGILLDAEDRVNWIDDELASYESQNENYHDTIRDSAEMIQELIDKVNDSKKLNHSELVKRLTEIYDNLWEEV